MLEVDSSIIGTWIGAWMWPFIRIGAFFLAAPIFGTQLVSARIRVVLAMLLTMAIAPNLPAMPTIDAVSVSAFLLVSQQILIGIALGFIMQLLLQVFVVGGQIIAMHMGLGFASMVDPSNGVTVTVLSQFHLILITLLFVTMDGHLVMIEVLAESFYAMPVGAEFISKDALMNIAGAGGWMFASALLLSLPAVASLMIVNMSLGVVTRAAPQLNIFSIGFPSMLILGLCIVWVTLSGYIPLFYRFTSESLAMMAALVTR